jgi:hypothetical protein
MNNIASEENTTITNHQNVTKAQLINDVQRWVLADTQLKQLTEKIKQMREVKSAANANIMLYMKQTNYNGNIKISDGELRIYEKKEYSPLTYSYIEKCLAKIIPDETHVEYIIQYLKENREVTTNQDIKRIPKKI